MHLYTDGNFDVFVNSDHELMWNEWFIIPNIHPLGQFFYNPLVKFKDFQNKCEVTCFYLRKLTKK